MASRISSGNAPHDVGATLKTANAKQRQFSELLARRQKVNVNTAVASDARRARIDRVEIKAEKSAKALEKVSDHKTKINAERQALHDNVDQARDAVTQTAQRIADARIKAAKDRDAAQARFAAKLDASSKASALSAATGANGEALSLRSAVAGQSPDNMAAKIEASYEAQNKQREIDEARQRAEESKPAEVEQANQRQQIKELYDQGGASSISMASQSMSMDASMDEPFTTVGGVGGSVGDALSFGDQQELGDALKRATEQESQLQAAREVMATARAQMESLDKQADAAELQFAETLRDEAFAIEKSRKVVNARRVIETMNAEQVSGPTTAPPQAQAEFGPEASTSNPEPGPRPQAHDVAQHMIELREESKVTTEKMKLEAEETRLTIKEAVERLSVLESDAGEQITAVRKDVKLLASAMGEQARSPRLENAQEAQRVADEIAQRTIEDPSEALASQPFLSVQTALRVLD